MLQIVNLIFGLLWLLKGEIKVGSKRRVKRPVAKGLGVTLLIVAALPLLSFDEQLAMFFTILEFIAPILVIIIGLASSEKIEPDTPAQTNLPLSQGSPQQSQTKPSKTTTAEPAKRLQELKDLLDNGLISTVDYESKKTEILSKM